MEGLDYGNNSIEIKDYKADIILKQQKIAKLEEMRRFLSLERKKDFEYLEICRNKYSVFELIQSNSVKSISSEACFFFSSANNQLLENHYKRAIEFCYLQIEKYNKEIEIDRKKIEEIEQSRIPRFIPDKF